MTGKISDDPDFVLTGPEKFGAAVAGADIAPTSNSIATFVKSFLRGQYLGTATNDSAAAGNIGEVIDVTVATGSAVSLTNNVTADVASITLPPGEWMIFGNVEFVPGGSTVGTAYQAAISTVSGNTLPASPNGGAYAAFFATTATGTAPSMPVGATIVKIASNTTYYLKAYSLFSASTMKAAGYLGATRLR
jgi:hypothetical protein